jgi:hypothetical protein
MNYGKDHPDALITRTKSFIDVVNRKFSNPANRHSSTWSNIEKGEIDRWISGISYGLNNVIITKATKEEYKFLNEGYGYMDNVKPHNERDSNYQQQYKKALTTATSGKIK